MNKEYTPLIIIQACFVAFIICLILLFALVSRDEIDQAAKVESQRNAYTEQKIKDLEKEIRLLRQDIYILENGFEGEWKDEQ